MSRLVRRSVGRQTSPPSLVRLQKTTTPFRPFVSGTTRRACAGSPHLQEFFCAMVEVRRSFRACCVRRWNPVSDGRIASSNSILLPTGCKSCRTTASVRSVACSPTPGGNHDHTHHHPCGEPACPCRQGGSRYMARNATASPQPWRACGGVGPRPRFV